MFCSPLGSRSGLVVMPGAVKRSRLHCEALHPAYLPFFEHFPSEERPISISYENCFWLPGWMGFLLIEKQSEK